MLYPRIVDCCDVLLPNEESAPRFPAEEQKRDATPRGRALRSGSVLGAIAVALLPKCPACWSVYAGLSSLLGLSIAIEVRYLLPLTVALLALALAGLGIQARRRRRYGPWWLACAAAALTLVGKFVLESEPLLYAGSASLLLAALWARSSVRTPRTLPSSAG